MENGVGYVRRNALAPVPAVADWDELNACLFGWCERDRRHAAWLQERAARRSLPPEPFRAAQLKLVSVSTLSLVTFDRNRYSVPCELGAGRCSFMPTPIGSRSRMGRDGSPSTGRLRPQ